MSRRRPPSLKSFPVTKREGFQIIHQRNSLLLIGDSTGSLDVRSLPLTVDGVGTWEPGTKFTQLGSKKVSAGFPRLIFTDPYPPLRYVGILTAGEDVFACFENEETSVFTEYFAYHYSPDMGLYWGTDNFTSRRIEMTDCQPPPKP